MNATYDQVTLFLSSGGSFITLSSNEGNIHPKLKEAVTLKTKFTVLKFLKSMQTDPEILNTVNFFHEHNITVKNHGCPIGFGLHHGRAHECPLEKMIDFVKGQIHILTLSSIEEINTYLEWNQPEVEIGFWGNRTVKFNNYSVGLDRLINFVKTIAEKTSFRPDREWENGNSLLEKITSYNQLVVESLQEGKLITQFLAAQSDNTYQDLLKDLKEKLHYVE